MLACHAYCDPNAKQRFFLGCARRRARHRHAHAWRQLGEVCKDKVNGEPRRPLLGGVVLRARPIARAPSAARAATSPHRRRHPAAAAAGVDLGAWPGARRRRRRHPGSATIQITVPGQGVRRPDAARAPAAVRRDGRPRHAGYPGIRDRARRSSRASRGGDLPAVDKARRSRCSPRTRCRRRTSCRLSPRRRRLPRSISPPTRARIARGLAARRRHPGRARPRGRPGRGDPRDDGSAPRAELAQQKVLTRKRGRASPER